MATERMVAIIATADGDGVDYAGSDNYSSEMICTTSKSDARKDDYDDEMMVQWERDTVTNPTYVPDSIDGLTKIQYGSPLRDYHTAQQFIDDVESQTNWQDPEP